MSPTGIHFRDRLITTRSSPEEKEKERERVRGASGTIFKASSRYTLVVKFGDPDGNEGSLQPARCHAKFAD